MRDTIIIKGLAIPVCIGITEQERSKLQTVKMNLEIVPKESFSNLDDNIEKAVNYFDVSERVKQIAAAHPRKLIETLAEDIAVVILNEFKVDELRLEIEKFILKDTDYVGLKIRRMKKTL